MPRCHPEAIVNDISTSTGATQVATAFADLGIADVIGHSAFTAAQIATRFDTDADATRQLLPASGLCRMNPRTGAVSLTCTGRLLRSDHPHSLREWVMALGSRVQTEAWTGLADTVRTGRSAFVEVHGMSIWEWFDRHPTDARVLDEAMRCATTITADIVAATRGRKAVGSAMSAAASERSSRGSSPRPPDCAAYSSTAQMSSPEPAPS